ncbi:MAG: ECF-type sigma factor [Marinicellaceae bacterium]
MNEHLTQIINNSGMENIVPEVYDELVKLARSALNKNKRHATLDTSAVVNESVIKFYNKKSHTFASRGHFYALMSKIMRDLIIDYARHKNAQIRGGHLQKVTMTGISMSDNKQEYELSHILDMDKAMKKLAEFDKELEQMLAMKFYGGLTISDLAECFNTSESTIKRELRTARAFVKSQLPDY